MAVEYWDYADADSSETSYYYSSSESTTDGGWFSYNASWCRPRRCLVEMPAHWPRQWTLDYVKLVNIKTRTGWIIEMVIEGDVLITDPDIDYRTLKQFIPLLKKYASKRDRERIDVFLDEHPLQEKENNHG